MYSLAVDANKAKHKHITRPVKPDANLNDSAIVFAFGYRIGFMYGSDSELSVLNNAAFVSFFDLNVS
jgi:hypothetical protein